MVGSTKGLKEYAKNKSKVTLEKVDKAIRELSLNEQKINFNSVSKLRGLSHSSIITRKSKIESRSFVRSKPAEL